MATASAMVSSTLNPNAPLFVPSPVDHTDAVLDFEPEWEVEDFSPEWWTLVQTSPAFREHWLQEFDARNEDDLDALMQLEEADESADLDKEEPEVKSPVFSGADIRALVASMKSLEVKISKSSLKNELLKYHNYKTPKIAPTDMKRSSFRRIQQPR